jgi:hypothetical protein
MKPSFRPNSTHRVARILATIWIALISFLPLLTRAATYTVTLPPGFTILANHLAPAGIQTFLGAPFPQVFDMQAVFPSVPYGPGPTAAFVNDSTMWLEAETGNPATQIIGNGDAMFIYNPTLSPIAATLSGPLTAGIVPLNPAVPGWHLRGRQNIGPGTFESTFGRSPRDYQFVHAYRFIANNYVLYQFANSANPANRRWSPSAPILDVGEGIWYRLGPSTGPANPQYFAPDPVNFTITGVSPASGNSVNSPISIQVTGSGLATGDQIRLRPMMPGPQTAWTAGVADPDGYVLTASMNVGSLAKGYYRVDVRKPPGTPQTLDNVFYLNAPSSQLTVNLTGPTLALAANPTPTYQLLVTNPSGSPVNNVDLSVVIPGYPANVSVTLGAVNASPGPVPFVQVGGVGVQTLNPFTIPPNGWVIYSFTITPSLALLTSPATTLQLVGQITSPNPQVSQSVRLVEVVASMDPNDKSGPVGVGEPRYITGLEPSEYTIRFENKPDATAPAHEVVIVDQLDPTRVDLATFELGEVRFGSKIVTPPPGLQNWSTQVPYDVDGNPATTADNILVRVEATMDGLFSSSTYGEVRWKFSSRESVPPHLPVVLPNVGFLPANVTSPQGEGSVSFKVTPFSNLGSGQTIENQASIVFDQNAAILTGTWTNTIDIDAPRSSVQPLSSPSASTFSVQWAGDDGDSGIARYDVYVSDDGGPFEKWQDGTSATQAEFTGQVQHTYRFHSVAIDKVGNLEDAPETPDAVTTVIEACPLATIAIRRTIDGITLTWEGAGYRLQTSSDLRQWDDEPNATSPTTLPADTGHRFFRLICK